MDSNGMFMNIIYLVVFLILLFVLLRILGVYV